MDAASTFKRTKDSRHFIMRSKEDKSRWSNISLKEGLIRKKPIFMEFQKINFFFYKTCSQIAIESGHTEIANMFMQENEGDKEALMFDSAETGNISLLTKLLNEGIDPNIEISNENKIYNDYGVFSLKNVFFFSSNSNSSCR